MIDGENKVDGNSGTKTGTSRSRKTSSPRTKLYGLVETLMRSRSSLGATNQEKAGSLGSSRPDPTTTT